jgi:hypothetical protein
LFRDAAYQLRWSCKTAFCNWLACLLLPLAFLGACSPHGPGRRGEIKEIREIRDIYISGGVRARLLPPGAFRGELSEAQKVRVRPPRGGAELAATSLVELSGDGMRVMVFADMARILTLSYTPAGIECEVSPLVPAPRIDPEYVLFDVQLIYFPADTVDGALPEGMSFCEEGAVRALYRGEKKIASIVREGGAGGTIEFTNFERSYSYRIEPIVPIVPATPTASAAPAAPTTPIISATSAAQAGAPEN